MGDEDVPDGGFGAVADALDQFREMLRAMVAGLVADGYTEAQARLLVVAAMAANVPGD